MEYPKFKMCVRCFTFNQAKYIEDTMNGFVMQQTDFPFVCCIVDDASTDGEQDVIDKYLLDNFNFLDKSGGYRKDTDYAFVKFARHKNNYNCYFAVLFLKENHYGSPLGFKKKFEYISGWRNKCKYEAFCEGDDYWIDPFKLQKQIDYMKQHLECRYLFTARIIDYEKSFVKIEQKYKKRDYTTFDILSGFNPGIQNAVWYVEDMERMMEYRGINGDRLYPYLSSLRGKIHYLNEVTSVYRVTGEGVSTKINEENVFFHSSNDFYNFHKILGFPNTNAYLKGEARYLVHNLSRYPFFKIPNAFVLSYKILKSINERLTVWQYFYMIYYQVLSKIKNVIGCGDIKTKGFCYEK